MVDTTAIRAYHERTKHHLSRYAAGPGYLDWANQPDPFRQFSGAPRHPWSLAADEVTCAFSALLRPGGVDPHPLTDRSLSVLFELSLGLSAWKAIGGDRWALRCTPSSGNLHPTEAYLVTAGVPGLEAGVYHYLSLEHALECRAALGDGFAGSLPEGGVLVGLSSIHWREAWKYGERAYRYCQHDAGHAAAAIRYAAAALGWRATLLPGWGDGQIASALGLDRPGDFGEAEPEAPGLVLWVGPASAEPPARDLVRRCAEATWLGKANVLSPQRLDWPAVQEASRAALKPFTRDAALSAPVRGLPPLGPPGVDMAAQRLFRQRRSAVAFDGVTSLPAGGFFHLLDTLLPRPGVPPFDVLPWPPRVHLALFVHRVSGLDAGLYALPRGPEAEDSMRRFFRRDWAWESVEDCPCHLPLRRLALEDLRETARVLSCMQEIAADSAFSLAMVAEFDGALEGGPWWYRRLFWECGAVGQALYLGAEAEGLRGTGIGCYFDDEVHRLLGIDNSAFQSLYHFTIGGALEDGRLTTLPPYAHLKGVRAR